jgi:3-deoxy-D-manno-octulosonic-acid transferase
VKFLYLSLTRLYTTPIAIVAIILRLFGEKTQIERIGWGLPSNRIQGSSLWLVASSVGEVNIALRLIARLKEIAARPVILTVTTKSGRQHAIQGGCKADIVCYHPLDIKFAVRRFLRTFHPTAIVMIETELWPALMEQSLEQGVALMQVSGRLSERSLRHYLPLKPLFRPLLQRCKLLLMQSEEDATRMLQLSECSANIEVVGSIKTVYVLPPAERLRSLTEYLTPWERSSILTCGSTRPGEEEILLDAFVMLRRSSPDLKLVLAPRHLDRISEVVELLKQHHLSFSRRSQSSLSEETSVLLLDTIGELNLFYHRSRVAFVGGTLVPFGGHNLLEPALAGCPVMYGPHYENQKVSQVLLVKHHLGFQVDNSVEFSDRVVSILGGADGGEQLTICTNALRAENASVVDIYVTKILELLSK